MKRDFQFTLNQTTGRLRAGTLVTPHGVVETPVFMPVGTKAAVKALDHRDLVELGAQIILANTYHLHLAPGEKLIQSMGGLHRFTRWGRPMLTDSGGFQVSSLGYFKKKSGERMSRIDEEGVTFYSHIDGSRQRLTPEDSIGIQEALGADIIMAFDEATPDRGKTYAWEAMERTHRWLKRSVEAWEKLEADKTNTPPQSLWGIVQGGNYADLREVSAKYVSSFDLFGVGIGGGSVGQDPEETAKNVSWVKPFIPQDKPVYAMGVGVNPEAAVKAIQAGVDMFDCVGPTRWARTGWLTTGQLEIPGNKPEKAKFVSPDTKGRIVIDKEQFAKDAGVIEPTCDCFVCREGYSRAYLHHLFQVRELTYYRLASIHNLSMMVRTVEKMREAIRRR